MSKQLAAKTLSGALSGTLVKTAASSPAFALQAFNSLVEAHNSYRVVREQEITKRQQIAAWEKTQITAIREQASIIHDYLDKSFAERRENFSQLFTLLDKGIESGNDQAIQAALTGIIETTRQSPLREALAAVRAISDPSVKSIDI
ncbi:MAG TPA: hypothetical protein ENO09_00910 [bacterium]|nr:hypothetical protein [bacterium]